MKVGKSDYRGMGIVRFHALKILFFMFENSDVCHFLNE